MAKVAFSKLGLKEKKETISITINNVQIEVKQYLPINEKVDLITRIISNTHNPDVNYYNPILLEVISDVEIVMAYTNLSFTEKQKEDISKLFDILDSNDIINQIIDAIPVEEYSFLIQCIEETIDSIYTYQQSVLGILDTMSKDYSNLDLDATKIQEKLADPESLQTLKDVLSKMG